MNQVFLLALTIGTFSYAHHLGSPESLRPHTMPKVNTLKGFMVPSQIWVAARYLIPQHEKPSLLLRMRPMQGPFFLQAPRASNLESSCLPRVLLRHSLWVPAFNPTESAHHRPSCFSSHFLLV